MGGKNRKNVWLWLMKHQEQQSDGARFATPIMVMGVSVQWNDFVI